MSTRFQWPPRPVDERELRAPERPDYWKPQPASQPRATPGRSHTPRPNSPSDPADLLHEQDAATPASELDGSELPAPVTRSGPPWSAWRQIEAVFLGVTRPAFRDRAADAGWCPDSPSIYCPRCATSTGIHEATVAGCTRCSSIKLPWDRAVRLGRYEGLLRTSIQEVKFSAWRRLGVDLGRELGLQLQPLIEGTQPRPDADKLVIVPVPTPGLRRILRGVDHTSAIAAGVHQVLGGTLAKALRRRWRRPQVGLSSSDRQRNVTGSILLRGQPRFDGCTVFVVDDVRTTGATMGEAVRVLRRELKKLGQTPAAVWACTVAVAELGDSKAATNGR